MSETLEKEVLEAEKSGTIFETELFDHIYSDVSAAKDELRQELQTVLLDGLRKFVEKKIRNTEPINWEAVEIAFFAATAISLGGDYCKKNRKESMVATAKKRVIRKENLIGFNAGSGYKISFKLQSGTQEDVVLPNRFIVHLPYSRGRQDVLYDVPVELMYLNNGTGRVEILFQIAELERIEEEALKDEVD